MRALARRFVNYDDPGAIGTRMRARRARDLVTLIRRVHAERGSVSIIDVGGTRRYWNILPEGLLEDCDVRVTLVNLPGTPVGTLEDRFSATVGDGCDLSAFADDAFDVAHSNSVIEHVGDWSRMRTFAAEVRRVGRHVFVQTPHFWFPVEPHAMTPLLHWMPVGWQRALVMRWNLGNWSRQDTVDAAMRTVESARLLDRPMMDELFGADAEIRTERFLGLPKSMVAIGRGAAAAGD